MFHNHDSRPIVAPGSSLASSASPPTPGPHKSSRRRSSGAPWFLFTEICSQARDRPVCPAPGLQVSAVQLRGVDGRLLDLAGLATVP